MRITKINGSKIVRCWTHSEFNCWTIHQTEDNKFWLDTDPESNDNLCSEISESEAKKCSVGEPVEQ